MAVYQVLHKVNSFGWNTDRQRLEASPVAAYTESEGGPVIEIMDLPDAAVALDDLEPATVHAACHAWAVLMVSRLSLSSLIGPVFVEAGTEYTPAP